MPAFHGASPRRSRRVAFAATAAFLSLSTFSPRPASAAPFDKWLDHRLPDGRVVRIHGEGDEYGARFEDEAGRPLVYVGEAGRYEYAAVDPDTGAFVPSGIPLGDDPAVPAMGAKAKTVSSVCRLADVGETDESEATREAARARFEALSAERGTAARWAARKANAAAARSRLPDLSGTEGADAPSSAPPSSPTSGRIVGVTLLVDFPLFDDTGVQTNTLSATAHPGVTADDLRALVNGPGFTKFGNASSVRDYYAAATSGHVDYTNVVIGWVTMPNERSHYDVATRDSGVNGRALIGDALAAVAAHPLYRSQWLPALREATVNGNGEFLALNVFFAGEEATTWAYGLWAHQWVLAETQYAKLLVPMADGSKAHFRSYQISPVTSSPTIHTFCHESGHMICDFPDLYAYSTGLGNGVGMWCLMCGRIAGGDTDPQNFCAYLRAAAGWVEPKALPSASGYVSVSADLQDVWKFPHPTDPGQYYLVENRQARGVDKNLKASGVVIYRCDESGDNTTGARTKQSVFSSYGYAANRLSYEVSVEQADGLYEIERDVRGRYNGDPDDTWRADNGADGYANQFNALSTPCARWTDGSAAAINLFDFSANGETMTFWNETGSDGGSGGGTGDGGGTGTGTGDDGDAIDLASAIYVNGIDTSKHSSHESAGAATYWRVTDGRIVLRGGGPYVVSGTGTTPVRCAVTSDEWTSCKVVISNLRIRSSDETYGAFDCGSKDVEMAIVGTNSLVSTAYSDKKSRPALHVGSGVTLTISGRDDARLTCQSGKYAAGIGGGYSKGWVLVSDNDAGSVRVLGGTVEATGGYNGAGIGGGSGGTLGRVDVYDALVAARGGTGAAGIGGGYKGSSGHFFNYGGTVWATGGNGDGSTPDIGRGADSTSKLAHRLYLSGGSTSLANGYVTGMTAASNATERVYRVVVPDLAPGAAVAFDGLPAKYGQNRLVADAAGQVHLWLPNDDYAFTDGDLDWTATVAGGKTLAETISSEYGRWLVRHGFLDHPVPTAAERAAFETTPGPCRKPAAGGGVLSVRDEYVAGLDPADPDSLFRADIALGPDGPVVTWDPDLNEGGALAKRAYVVEGRASLDPADPWRDVSALSPAELAAAGIRFFRVRVAMP